MALNSFYPSFYPSIDKTYHKGKKSSSKVNTGRQTSPQVTVQIIPHSTEKMTVKTYHNHLQCKLINSEHSFSTQEKLESQTKTIKA